jgi:hypothetical protein
MLLYAYFAKRQRRREQTFEAQHNAAEPPQLVVSDHTTLADTDSPNEKPSSPESGLTSPRSGLTSPQSGLETPGATLSPTQTGPGPGLTPLDSRTSSTGYAQNEHHEYEEHPEVSRANALLLYTR